MSQCYINLENYHKARDSASEALKIKTTEKALYRIIVS